MSCITVSAEALLAIKSELAVKGGCGPVRIELRSTGCCDGSLGLCQDGVQLNDIQQDIDGITFVIGCDLQRVVGEVLITRIAERDQKGYLLTSSIPLNEWQGFAPCDLRFR